MSFPGAHDIRRFDVYCCARGVFCCCCCCCCCCCLQQRTALQPKFQIFMQWSETKNDFVPIRTPERPPDPNKTPTSKCSNLVLETPMELPAATMNTKAIRQTCRVCCPQDSCELPRRDRGRQNTCLDVPLAYVRWSALSRKQWRLTLEAGKVVEVAFVRSKIRLAAWAVTYFTDHL